MELRRAASSLSNGVNQLVLCDVMVEESEYAPENRIINEDDGDEPESRRRGKVDLVLNENSIEDP
jgi:hypothetical protein